MIVDKWTDSICHPLKTSYALFLYRTYRIIKCLYGEALYRTMYYADSCIEGF